MSEVLGETMPHTDSVPPVSAGRILMGVPAAGATGGGPALHLPMLVEDLRAEGFEVTTFAYGRWREGESLWGKIAHQLQDVLRFPALVRAASPDLVHLNTAFDRKAILRDVFFAGVARALGKPVYLKWHGSEVELLAPPLLWRSTVALLLRFATRIGVLSTEEAAALERRADAPPCDVVRNGLDLARYELPAEIRSRHAIPASAPLLLFVSRLLPAKGLLDVVAALPEVVARHGAHLVVVGDGPTRLEAERRAHELGVAPSVHFTGSLPETEVTSYYRGCDVLVFPTYHAEGFPMTVFQSVAAGLGIVTTRLRASADYLREPEHCLFVPPRDPASLARALDRLLADPALLASMRRNNRELSARFERRRVAREFGGIYRELLQLRESAGR